MQLYIVFVLDVLFLKYLFLNIIKYDHIYQSKPNLLLKYKETTCGTFYSLWCIKAFRYICHFCWIPGCDSHVSLIINGDFFILWVYEHDISHVWTRESIFISILMLVDAPLPVSPVHRPPPTDYVLADEFLVLYS